MRAGVLVAMSFLLLGAPPTHAEVDWPLSATLPQHDIAVGLTGGVALGEGDGPARVVGAGGLDVSYLHGTFGAHLSLSVFPERTGIRIQPLAEVTLWYVALFGAGVSVSPMVGDVPDDVPATAVALHVLLGFPIPLWSSRDSEREAGALFLVPFARPGLRLGPQRSIEGHHTMGMMLKWTSFAF